MRLDRLALICRSHALAAVSGEALSAAFHAALTRLNPTAAARSTDSEACSRWLATLLGVLVESQRHPQRCKMLFATLARRYARRDMDDAIYDDIGAALLIALREVLGKRYNEAVEEAWASLYAELAETMIGQARCATA